MSNKEKEQVIQRKLRGHYADEKAFHRAVKKLRQRAERYNARAKAAVEYEVRADEEEALLVAKYV